MGLFDLKAGKGKDGGDDKPPPSPMSITVKAEPLDAKSAARKFVEALGEALGMKAAIREKDVEDVLDAFKLLDVATEADTGEGPEEKDEPEEGEHEDEDDAAAE